MSKQRLAYDTVRSVARELGAAIVDEGHGGRHRFVVLETNGRRRKLFYPSTPGDHRGHLNLKCDVKKAILALRSAQ